MMFMYNVDKEYCKEFPLAQADFAEKVALGIPYEFEDNSKEMIAIELNGEPLAIGGLSEDDNIWLLVSPLADELTVGEQVEFVSNIKCLLDRIQFDNPEVPFFDNIVWSRLEKHHKFIEMMGGVIHYNETIKSKLGEDFYYFHIDNPHYQVEE